MKKEVSEYMRKLGKKGGEALLKKRGPKYMQQLARDGWKVRRQNRTLKSKLRK